MRFALPLLAALLLAALVVFGSLPPAADAGCRSSACVERVARKACDRGRIVECIRRAALHRGQSFSDMRRVAWCESRLDPRAVSRGGHVGLFQFAWGTWRTTPYARRSPFSAKWASLAAAWMWSVGRRGEWSCR